MIVTDSYGILHIILQPTVINSQFELPVPPGHTSSFSGGGGDARRVVDLIKIFVT